MIFEEFREILVKEFPEVTEKQIRQFRDMEALYREWNARINVISRKDIDGVYEHHVLHSLSIASYWKRSGTVVWGSAGAGGTVSVLDLGTGGGFPGIPLAVMCPDLDFTLCDSIGKKVLVAREVASALELDNVRTVNARAESLPETFDHVVSRAVTTLDNFYPWVRDRFRGSIFYLKGGDVNEEISVLMSHHHLGKGAVSTWRIDSWLDWEYFAEKFVIQIEKD